MYQAIQHLHSYWAYLVVLAVSIATLNALYSFFSNKEYSYKDFRLSLFALIVTHLQFVIGLVLYFVSPLGLQSISNNSMGVVMKDSTLRLYAVEHPTVMLLTAVFILLVFDFCRLFLDILIFPTTTFLEIRASVLRKTRRIDPRTPEGPVP